MRKNCLLQVLIIAILVDWFFNTECSQIKISHQTKRSVKTTFPKNGNFGKSRRLQWLTEKVTKLEKDNSNENRKTNSELNDLHEQYVQFEEEFEDQEHMINELEIELRDIYESVTLHENPVNRTSRSYFSVSDNTCGQLLKSKTGIIRFGLYHGNGNSSIFQKKDPWAHKPQCVWTLQSGRREFIKITTHSLYLDDKTRRRPDYYEEFDFVREQAPYVLEVARQSHENGSVNYFTKMTLLTVMKSQIFSGPVVLIVYPLSISYHQLTHLQLEFETFGKKTLADTYYNYGQLEPCSNVSECMDWNSSSIKPVKSSFLKYPRELVILVSEFTTKAFFQITGFDKSQCHGNDTFLVFSNFEDNGSNIIEHNGIDCCQQDCNTTMITYDKPLLILINKRTADTFNFHIPVQIEKKLSHYKNGTCGGVLGGMKGYIKYKSGIDYDNNERCIWAVVPQPFVTSWINFQCYYSEMEKYYDHLYLMYLSDINGTLLADGPVIMKLENYHTYRVPSRHVFVIFYSDKHVTGTGFHLTYYTAGDPVTDRINTFTQFEHHTDPSDKSLVTLNSIQPRFQVEILNPVISTDAYDTILKVKIQSDVEGSCENGTFQHYHAFTTQDGIFQKMPLICDNSSTGIFSTLEPMALIVSTNLEPNNTIINSKAEISWTVEPVSFSGNKSFVITDEKKCGGFIEADSGQIQYLLQDTYSNSERCIWTILSSKSFINFNLLRDGFEQCCDFIEVTNLNFELGVLNSSVVQIRRISRKATVATPAIIVFRSDNKLPGTGFILEFSSSDDEFSSPYNITVTHNSNPYGQYVSSKGLSLEHPLMSADVNDSKHLHILTYSQQTMEEKLKLTGNFMYGVFKRGKSQNKSECLHESITAYTFQDSSGLYNIYQFPRANQTTLCSQIMPVGGAYPWFESLYSAFVVIRKSLGSGGLVGFNWRRANKCGDIFVGESGYITYKEREQYFTNEKCMWLVEVPSSSRITFTLENQGLESCCDYLMLSSIDPVTGVPGNISMLGYQDPVTNLTALSTTVDGPLVVVAFKSDNSNNGFGFTVHFSANRMDNGMTLPYQYVLGSNHSSTVNPSTDMHNFKAKDNTMMVSILGLNKAIVDTPFEFRRYNVQVKAFRPQVNSDCDSDQFFMYAFPDKDTGFQVLKQFEANDVMDTLQRDDNDKCLPITDEQMSDCQQVEKCSDMPKNGDFSLNSTYDSVLMIYRTVLHVPDVLANRGFHLVSSFNSSSSILSNSNTDTTNIAFYERASYLGASLTLRLDRSKPCHNFPSLWENRISSVSLNYNCISLFDSKDCIGRYTNLTQRSDGKVNLRYSNFDETASSVRLNIC